MRRGVYIVTLAVAILLGIACGMADTPNTQFFDKIAANSYLGSTQNATLGLNFPGPWILDGTFGPTTLAKGQSVQWELNFPTFANNVTMHCVFPVNVTNADLNNDIPVGVAGIGHAVFVTFSPNNFVCQHSNTSQPANICIVTTAFTAVDLAQSGTQFTGISVGNNTTAAVSLTNVTAEGDCVVFPTPTIWAASTLSAYH